MKKILPLFILALSCLSAPAQNTDSLYAIWNDPQQADTVRLSAIEDFLWAIQHSDPDSAEKCAGKMLALSKRSARNRRPHPNGTRHQRWNCWPTPTTSVAM
ncbi:MAG: hypothetical protein IPO56_16720 [Flavobacteriales bacterium]|nr:hypothetical protein [Flavobacteriales bacterium]